MEFDGPPEQKRLRLTACIYLVVGKLSEII
jgi:hypothetical protein